MHREVSHRDEAFHQESNAGLFILTGLIGLLIGLHLWPDVAAWLGPKLGVSLPRLWDGITLGGITFSFAQIAAVIGGARILYGSLEGLMAGRVGADLALAIAVIAALLIQQPLVAAEVVLIGLIGECLEAFTFNRTQRAIRRLVEVCPRLCLVVRDGQEVRTRVEDVRFGERVLVRPGKRVPVDGVVIEGRSAVDQSTLTGESLPVDKGSGDEVFAGTLNQFGALVVEVRRVAEHTVVGQVIELTARALREKAAVERTADRLARYFLPVVLGLALLTFLVGWWWFSRSLPWPTSLTEAVFPALAVLVVACPCALILATPAAIIATLGRLAGSGVLIKGGEAIERLAAVNAWAFDKTGTLTEGRAQLAEIIPLSGSDLSQDQLLQWAATAEQRSEHLLAQVVVQEARARSLELAPLEEFQAHPGAGVSARTSRETLLVGSGRLLTEQNLTLPPEADEVLKRLDEQGQTALFVARNGQVVGVIGVRDTVRPEAAGVIRELEGLGIADIVMLTGDRAPAAREVARQLGIQVVQAECLPQQKAEHIEEWRRQGRNVAMVGDGINDAPALARSNVGLALGGIGSDVAAEAGDFVLMGHPLQPLPLLVRLSRKTVEIIRQNILWFAFGVNAVGIVLTAWILPAWSEKARHDSPIWAAIYHQIGSLAVLLNSMRLLWFERGKEYAVVRRLQAASRSVDQWLERISFHEFTHWVEFHWKKLLGGTALAGLLLYGLTSLTLIRADEIGIVRRCGRPLEETLPPGLHFRLPWPWETVTRIQPDRIRTIEIGFRTVGDASKVPQAMTWSSPHRDGMVRNEKETSMITGDQSLVEIQMSVSYTLSDPRRYLLEVAQPEEVLRAVAEASVREVVKGWSLDELLTGNRDRFQQQVTAQLEQALSSPAYRIGVRLQSVAFQDLHPPPEILMQFYEVNRAMMQREQRVIAARRQHDQAISSAQVFRRTTEPEARAAAYAVESGTNAQWNAFVALTEVELAPLAERLLFPTPAAGLPNDLAALMWRCQKQVEDPQFCRQLIETQWRWQRIAERLTNRSKVIVDLPLLSRLRFWQGEMGNMRPWMPPLLDREERPPLHQGP
jgi:Cu+-exporting ATPase